MPDSKIGRNDPCHCNSGKKYKKCCEEKDALAQHKSLEKDYEKAAKNAAAKAEEEKSESATSGVAPKNIPLTNKGPVKHPKVTAPKFNLPRRSGGG